MIIDKDANRRAWRVWEIGQLEPEYAKMLVENSRLENKYEEALRPLPEDVETVIRDFVSQCEAMSWRMLEISCALMRFPEEIK